MSPLNILLAGNGLRRTTFLLMTLLLLRACSSSQPFCAVPTPQVYCFLPRVHTSFSDGLRRVSVVLRTMDGLAGGRLAAWHLTPCLLYCLLACPRNTFSGCLSLPSFRNVRVSLFDAAVALVVNIYCPALVTVSGYQAEPYS